MRGSDALRESPAQERGDICRGHTVPATCRPKSGLVCRRELAQVAAGVEELGHGSGEKESWVVRIGPQQPCGATAPLASLVGQDDGAEFAAPRPERERVLVEEALQQRRDVP